MVASLMQENANVNSVKPPMAPQKQRITVTSQMQPMITTKMQYSWKQKCSQVSIQYVDQPQMPNGIGYNTSISTSLVCKFFAWRHEQYLHVQCNSYTSGCYATCALDGYSSRNTTHTVLSKLEAWP